MAKGIVFFDIDGTLIDCTRGIMEPTQKTKQSMLKLKNNGYKIGIASGRPKSFIHKSILDLPIDAIVTSNGSYVEVNEEIISNRTISTKLIEEIFNDCVNNKMSFVLEGQDKSYYKESISEEVINFFDEFNICKKNMLEIKDYDYDLEINKVVIFIHNEEQYNYFKYKYEDKFNFMMHPNDISCDMYVTNYSKASGIKDVIKKLGLSDKSTYAFGDGCNDIEMFKLVNKGICMGNCDENLERYSFYKTQTVEDEGIYLGLKSLNII